MGKPPNLSYHLPWTTTLPPLPWHCWTPVLLRGLKTLHCRKPWHQQLFTWSEVSGVKAFLLEERSDWDVDLVYHVREGGYRVHIRGGYGIHIHQTPRYSKNYPQQSNPSRGLPAERAPCHWVLAQANSDTELRHRALHIMSFSRRLWGTGGRNPWDNVDRGAAIGLPQVLLDSQRFYRTESAESLFFVVVFS